MPFVLKQSATYPWPVSYEVARGNDKFDIFEFTAEFRRLAQSRLDELVKGAREDTITDDDLVDEILVGWSGIKDEQGSEFPYNDANRRILLDYVGMRAAIVRAFFNSVVGRPRKNL